MVVLALFDRLFVLLHIVYADVPTRMAVILGCMTALLKYFQEGHGLQRPCHHARQ